MDDASIRELNRDYRQQDKATNVLSFPQFDDLEDIAHLPDELPASLGDIIIALQVPDGATVWTLDADFEPIVQSLGLTLYSGYEM